MFSILGIIFYYLILAFIIAWFMKRSSFPLVNKEIFLVFGLKIVAGCLYGYIFLTFFGGDDTWLYHRHSLEEYQKLIKDPLQFIGELSPSSAIAGSNGFWQAIDFYIMDLENGIMAKTLGFFNLFSRGNYYINVVFFNFISFWGQYWLFATMVKRYPLKRTALFIAVFFIPPVVFWLSGIRAEGFLIFFFGMLIASFAKWLHASRIKTLIVVFVSLCGIVIFRNVLFLLVLPALTGWFISERFSKRTVPVFFTVYGISILLFFGSVLLSPEKNLPSVVVNRQQDFFMKHGQTRYSLDSLQPNPLSFISIAPQSINNTFFRPYIWEAKGAFQLMSAIEVIMVWFLFVVFLIYKEHDWKKTARDPLLIFLFLFSVSLYLFIGYTVPFPGAIVRYRILPELFLITLLATLINWQKAFKLK